MEVKLRIRSKMLLAFFLLVFVGMVYAYAQIELSLPKPKVHLATVERGRILTESGTVLAETAEGKRIYPQKTLAGQVVGYMGRDSGLEGLEKAYNDRLEAGKDVVVTLDTTFQSVAESVLAQKVVEQDAEFGSIVALDVHTGKILAVANYPAFDPNPDRWETNKWGELKPVRAYYNPVATRNHALLDEFEPGSVIKALTVAALLNDGATDMNREYACPMTRKVGRKTIHDVVARPKGKYNLNLYGILRYSSNVGMSHLVENFPPERLHDYFDQYGFGNRPKLGNVYVADGKLNDWRSWGLIGRATNSFGQGMSATTLQIASAYNVIASDGEFVPPQLVLHEQTSEPRRVLDEKTTELSRDLLRHIVEEGLPHQAGIDGYDLGGKTGTAQVAVGGRYSNDIYSSVFAGIFPLERPRVTMVVMVYGAKKLHHGSQVAAPIFRDIAAEMMSKWGIAPSTIAKT